MSRLIVTEYISLDGVMEAPGGGESFTYAGWTFRINRGPEGDAFKLEETRNTAALLFGRVTYEGMAAVWPHMSGEFADRWNALPKYVVSSTLSDPAWNNTHVLSGDLSTEIKQLVEKIDGEIVVHGSAKLVNALIKLDLVDELRLMTYPIVLGSGRRLFTSSDEPTQLRLTDVRAVGDGVVISTYSPDFSYHVFREMQADLDTVWKAWTDPDEYGTWFNALPGSVELDVQTGGSWRLKLKPMGDDAPELLSGAYVEVTPKEKLVMTTNFASGDTTMEMSFHPVEGKTRVDIRQTCASRGERDGGREGSLMLLEWCADYLAAT